MLESIILLLIYLCLLAMVVYLIIWVLGQVGIVIPPRIVQLLWVIVVLVVVLMLARMVLPQLSAGHLPGFGSMR